MKAVAVGGVVFVWVDGGDDDYGDDGGDDDDDIDVDYVEDDVGGFNNQDDVTENRYGDCGYGKLYNNDDYDDYDENNKRCML